MGVQQEMLAVMDQHMVLVVAEVGVLLAETLEAQAVLLYQLQRPTHYQTLVQFTDQHNGILLRTTNIRYKS